MKGRCLTALLPVIAIVPLALVPASGQTQTAAADSSTAARTPWGDPDLQGVWDFRTATPLERPAELAGKQFLTEEEAAELEQRAFERNTDEERPADAADDVRTAYNDFWYDRGNTVVRTRRTSLIVDPPNGKIPPLTPEGQKRVDALAEARGRPAASWEDRTLFERCLTRPLPRLPGGYNQNLQILQTPGYVVILYEMMREARFIPVDGQPHIPQDIRLWHGDSRGRWEGDTLVVDVTNFSPKGHFRGSAEGLHLVERFTRLDADTIEYQVTIDDPSTFTKAWTASVPMTKTQDPMYEYACHEGNYGMPNLLAGARAEEKAAEEAARTGSR